MPAQAIAEEARVQDRRAEAAAYPGASVGTRIEIARLLLVCGLVFIHYGAFPGESTNAFHGFNLTSIPAAGFVASYILYFFFSAVPVLSLIAGWLFFRDRPASTGLWDAVLRRGRSLVVPLVLWNLLALSVGTAAWAFGAHEWTEEVLGINPDRASAVQWLNATLGVTRMPAALQFWFVRDLIVTVLLAPLFWPLLQRQPWLLGILAGVWLFDGPTLIFLRPDVPLFFVLGGWARTFGDLRRIDAWPLLSLLLLYAIVVLARTAAPALLDEFDPSVSYWLGVATRLMRLVGVLTCLRIVAALADGPIGAWLAHRGRYAFFIFAGHYPLIQGIKAGSAGLMPDRSSACMLTHYFVSVGLTIMLCCLLAVGLTRVAPAIHRTLNGGRD